MIDPNWLLHPLGYCPPPSHQAMLCKGYAFWSGIGSDLGELTLIGIAVGAWRHINCHAPRCLRRGVHRTADGQWRLCRKHHPDLPDRRPDLEQILAAHAAAKARRRATTNDAHIGATTDMTW